MQAKLQFLKQGGELGHRILAYDWSTSPIGPIETWPATLRVALNLCINTKSPAAIFWGAEYLFFYNDTWASATKPRYEPELGANASEVFADVWPLVGPQVDHVLSTGDGIVRHNQRMDFADRRAATPSYWNYALTPIYDDEEVVRGVFVTASETTQIVVAQKERRAEVERLQELFLQTPGAVALVSGPDLRILMANPAALRLIGRANVINQPIADVLPELVGQGYIDTLNEVMATGIAHRAVGQSVWFRHDGKDQAPRIIDFVLQPIKRPDGVTTSIFIEVNDVTERVEAEARLRESEERLQLALSASNGVGVWDWDPQTDILRSDTRFAELYGFEARLAARGAPSKAFFAKVHPEDSKRVRDEIAAAMKNHSRFESEYRLIDNQDKIRWVSAQGQCSYTDTGTPTRFLGVAFEITARREAEEAARLAAAELEAATADQAFLHDIAEQQRALESADAIMELSAAALSKRLGIDRVGFYRVVDDSNIALGPCVADGALAPLVGTMTVEGAPAIQDYRLGETIINPETLADRRFAKTQMARYAAASVGVPLMRGGQWTAGIYVHQATPRQWRSDEVALIEAIAQSTWDAVERVEAVIALRESEAKFRAIANSIDPMVWATTALGEHDYYNDRWYEYTGDPDGLIDGRDWDDKVHPDDLPQTRGAWRRCLKTGELFHNEFRLKNRDGIYRWVLARAQPVRDENGEITRWFGTCTDIQDIVDAREVLARSREELEHEVAERTGQLMDAEDRLRQAQKMEALGQLTGGIAHDFNNMLAVVLGSIDLLERRLAQGQTDLSRYIVAARDGANRAAALTQRLLGFARQQPLAPVPLDVNALVCGMIDLLIRTLGEKVSIETKLESPLASALVDPNQLENVILNLSVNARDAMPDGGRLTIETAPHILDSEAAVSVGAQPGEYLALTVADTGSGMDEETAARAFDPFFTTKEVGKGTGLGLSQVFGFAQQSGGYVAIDTALGRGTRVTLFLPRHHGAPPAPQKRTSSANMHRGSPDEVILVVEDEERVRNHSVEVLRDLGYTVLDAPDGISALELIEAGQNVTLLFTDVVMPRMTGDELAREARQRLPNLKLLYTSGYTPRANVISQSVTLQATVLSKPYGVELLAAKIRQALDN